MVTIATQSLKKKKNVAGKPTEIKAPGTSRKVQGNQD